MIPAHLMYVYNDLGFTDLELAYTYKDEQGEVAFSKWHRFDKLMEQENIAWYKFTERRIADVEIVLDYDSYICPKCITYTSKVKCTGCGVEITIDEQKRRIKAFVDFKIRQLDKDKIRYRAYSSGGKGIHVHIIYPELRWLSKRLREDFKEEFITRYCAEKMKKIDRVMIMIESARHRKTGMPKNLIKEVKGYNYIR